METKGCEHRRKQGEQEPGRPPKMVHPARMDLPSCSMDQKVSQSLLRLGDILLDERLAVSHGDKTHKGKWKNRSRAAKLR